MLCHGGGHVSEMKRADEVVGARFHVGVHILADGVRGAGNDPEISGLLLGYGAAGFRLCAGLLCPFFGGSILGVCFSVGQSSRPGVFAFPGKLL